MLKCKNTLNDVVYGMNDAKIQIMQLIGKWIVNPRAIGTAIAIKGPMGTGKTTFIKHLINSLQKANKQKISEVTSPTFNITNEYQIKKTFKLSMRTIISSQLIKELVILCKETKQEILPFLKLSNNT